MLEGWFKSQLLPHLLANAPGRVVEDGTSPCTPATHVGEQDEVTGSQLRPAKSWLSWLVYHFVLQTNK